MNLCLGFYARPARKGPEHEVRRDCSRKGERRSREENGKEDFPFRAWPTSSAGPCPCSKWWRRGDTTEQGYRNAPGIVEDFVTNDEMSFSKVKDGDLSHIPFLAIYNSVLSGK